MKSLYQEQRDNIYKRVNSIHLYLAQKSLPVLYEADAVKESVTLSESCPEHVCIYHGHMEGKRQGYEVKKQ